MKQTEVITTCLQQTGQEASAWKIALVSIVLKIKENEDIDAIDQVDTDNEDIHASRSSEHR